MSPGQVSRRRALRIFGVAGAAGVASAVAASPAAADDPLSPSQADDTVTSLPVFGIVGVIADIRADRLVLRVGRRSLVVIPADGSSIYSGHLGKVNSIAALIVGDRVFVQGQDTENGVVVATSVGSVFDNVVLEVESVDAGRRLAKTSRGSLYLDGGLPDVGRVQHQIPLGVSIAATTWTDPRDRRTYLLLTHLDKIS
jgi:hypothetical protein